jgi:hypothetical protein
MFLYYHDQNPNNLAALFLASGFLRCLPTRIPATTFCRAKTSLSAGCCVPPGLAAPVPSPRCRACPALMPLSFRIQPSISDPILSACMMPHAVLPLARSLNLMHITYCMAFTFVAPMITFPRVGAILHAESSALFSTHPFSSFLDTTRRKLPGTVPWAGWRVIRAAVTRRSIQRNHGRSHVANGIHEVCTVRTRTTYCVNRSFLYDIY